VADAWGSSWGTPSAWAVSWATGVTPAPTVVVAEVGHAGRRHRRRVIIDDVIYVGTDEQIEAKLWELVQARKPKRAKAEQKKARKAAKPVELKGIPDYVPQELSLPRYEQLLADSYRHEDAFLSGMLKQMYLKFLEDDEEDSVLLLSL
jgi:hypothetical protein